MEKIKERLFVIIFQTDTKAGRIFDIVLIFAILFNTLLVMLDSVQAISEHFHEELLLAEWILTVIFTIEYILRIYVARNRRKYMTGFFGLVDLFSILPSYIGIFFPEAGQLVILRFLRIFRIFRILKLIQYMSESAHILEAIKNGRIKIYVFLFSVLNLAVIFGAIMYLVEGPENGFTSIPKSIYWAIVTLTTVGYGDISPQTVLGQVITTVIILMGYGIIAVPTGIMSAEMSRIGINRDQQTIQAKSDNVDIQKSKSIHCDSCHTSDHASDALFCKHCGTPLTHPQKPD